MTNGENEKKKKKKKIYIYIYIYVCGFIALSKVFNGLKLILYLHYRHLVHIIYKTVFKTTFGHSKMLSWKTNFIVYHVARWFLTCVSDIVLCEVYQMRFLFHMEKILHRKVTVDAHPCDPL